MIAAVFILSALVSATSAVLLLRGYRRSRERLLMAAGICFMGFALNDALLFADEVLFPDVSLLVLRTLPALLALIVLVAALALGDA